MTNSIREKMLEKQLPTQPTNVVYCNRCVMSNQRPRLEILNNGTCTACQFADEKYNRIDWNVREAELEKLLDKYRNKNGEFDIVVPGSGGKDSAYVAHQLKHRYGMHPLTVTWAPFLYTEIGWRNYVKFVESGFNNLLAYPNGEVHRKLARLAFEELGDAWQPFTYGQMCYAFHMALKFNIKIIFFGENGEAEYGGSTKNNYKSHMPLDDWALLYFKGCTVDKLIEFGIQNTDFFSKSDYHDSDLIFYRPPLIADLKKASIEMHWYSYYHKWIPQENFYYATEHTGFKANPERSEGTYSKYASLDDCLDGFHWYLAYIKFGIGRTTYDAAHEIRDGHLAREEAVALVNRFDGEFPKRYFHDFLNYLDISENHFWYILDSFRLPHLWEKKGSKWRLLYRII